MSSGFKDQDFQQHLVAFRCKDRNFLRKTSGLLEADDFKPKKKGGEGQEYHVLADLALRHWNDYGEPIGGLLSTYVKDYCWEKKVGSKLKNRLLDVVADIKSNNSLVAAEALEEKVMQYKRRRAKAHAIQEMLDLQEKGELTDDRFEQVTRNALKTFSNTFKIYDYLRGVEKRITRRRHDLAKKYPYLLIDPLDEAIRVTPRGTLAMLLAKWKTGKSVGLIWIATAFTMQGYNVLYITLEDPKEEVEDRFDASLTGLKTRQLPELPKRLRKRFKRVKERLRGRIKIVDGTEGGITVRRIEDIYEQQRNRGFVADLIVVDYDDEIVPPVRYKGDSARRQEFADIYRALRQLASKLDVWLWTAAQAKGRTKHQMVVSGEDTAEDISKIRKVAFCLGIGDGPKDWGLNSRHLYVAAHKFDKMKVGWNIVGDFERTVFYDREATERLALKSKKKRRREE